MRAKDHLHVQICRLSRVLLSIALIFAVPAVSGHPTNAAPSPDEPEDEQQEFLELLANAALEGFARAKQLQQAGRTDEAIEEAKASFELLRKILGDNHEATAVLAEFLADLHESAEAFDTGHEYRQLVSQIQTKLNGPGHWQVINARLAEDRNRLLARLPANRRADLLKAESLHARGVQLCQTGRHCEALAAASAALEIRRELLGTKHKDYAANLNLLAMVHGAQGDHARAEPLHRQAVEIADRRWGRSTLTSPPV